MRTDAEIETALELGKGKGIHRKIAQLWRSMLVGHPFTDGNKRTALMVALALLERSHMEMDEKKKENMVSAIKKIAEENITETGRIERLVMYAAEGH